MMGGRKKVEELGQRLKAVRAKVEASDHRDGEGRRRVGRRLRMLCGSLACLLMFILALLVLKQSSRVPEMNMETPSELGRMAMGNATGKLSSMMEQIEQGDVRNRNETSLRDIIEGSREEPEACVIERPTTENETKISGIDRVLNLLENL